mmetsp:Transcript_28534/g.55680  ORF Transcript_28534/g.55680 Transcript_28534/m.55680 type:complete len:213 (+) Transcript_28534:255-893(+)
MTGSSFSVVFRKRGLDASFRLLFTTTWSGPCRYLSRSENKISFSSSSSSSCLLRRASSTAFAGISNSARVLSTKEALILAFGSSSELPESVPPIASKTCLDSSISCCRSDRILSLPILNLIQRSRVMESSGPSPIRPRLSVIISGVTAMPIFISDALSSSGSIVPDPSVSMVSNCLCACSTRVLCIPLVNPPSNAPATCMAANCSLCGLKLP